MWNKSNRIKELELQVSDLKLALENVKENLVVPKNLLELGQELIWNEQTHHKYRWNDSYQKKVKIIDIEFDEKMFEWEYTVKNLGNYGNLGVEKFHEKELIKLKNKLI